MISIIIPTLNEESVIEGTIKKIKSELTIPHEIIVSDGKSKDKTVEIARKYADIVLEYKEEKRQTISMGRNAGAKVAKGDFLVFLDADCSIENPDKFFEYALNKFKNDDKLLAVTSRLLVGPKWATFADKFFSNGLSLAYAFINNILHIGIAWGEFQIVRRETLQKIHGYNETLTSGEDGDLFYRISKIGKTRLFLDMTVTHTGRRVHKVGWIYLLSLWWINAIWLFTRKKSVVKEWEVIR